MLVSVVLLTHSLTIRHPAQQTLAAQPAISSSTPGNSTGRTLARHRIPRIATDLFRKHWAIQLLHYSKRLSKARAAAARQAYVIHSCPPWQ